MRRQIVEEFRRERFDGTDVESESHLLPQRPKPAYYYRGSHISIIINDLFHQLVDNLLLNYLPANVNVDCFSN